MPYQHDKIINQLIQNPDVIGHSLNVFTLVYQVLCELPSDYLTYEERQDVLFSAIFHDVGKLQWPKEWFSKPGDLIPNQDLIMMKKHPIISGDIVKQEMGITSNSLDIISQHHERTGGKGYPYGAEPNRAAVLLAACDVFCACTEDRLYRQSPLGSKKALKQIAFAPFEVVEAIIQVCDIGEEQVVGY